MKTGFGIALLLALLSACSPPPKPYAPTAKESESQPPPPTVPESRIEKGLHLRDVKVGDSCFVISWSYGVAEDRSLWVDPAGTCFTERVKILHDIRIVKLESGYRAELVGGVYQGKYTAEYLSKLGYQRVLEIIP